jgi:hypothetical protein
VTTDDFVAAKDRLLHQVSHWETNRWKQNARADTVRALARTLADLGAEAEGNPHRKLPEVAETTLADQIRVLSDDLLAANARDEVLRAATEAVAKARHML